MIFPEIFDGLVMAFFTDKELGTDIRPITGRNVYFPIQRHTSSIYILENNMEPVVADGVLTTDDKVVLGVQVADCVPILLFEPERKVLGAVHAGWRSTAGGILRNAIEAMKARYDIAVDDLRIAMGPSIKWCCYEVGPDVLDAVKRRTGEGNYYSKRQNKLFLDIQTANKCQALAAGARERNISIVDECTHCQPERYYSYRFSKNTKGRQGGFIGMP